MRRIVLVAFTLLLAACSCEDPPATECGSSAECMAGNVCVDGACVPASDAGPGTDAGTGMDGGAPLDAGDDAGGPECTNDDACGDGVCVAGGCCATEAVCGVDNCCEGAETCFANACVVPGDSCRSALDCGEGEYCEPGLGEGGAGDAGVPDAGGPDGGVGACLGSAPSQGRCVALPARCEGEPMPGETCIRECVLAPGEPGPLDAVEQWRWGPDSTIAHAARTDVWATPAVGRLSDTNCDGVVDEFDPPNIVFVSGNSRDGTTGTGNCAATGTRCKTGVLRVLDGRTGTELWYLRYPSEGSGGFSGTSVALADFNDDGHLEIAAVTAEGFIVLIDREGTVLATSDAAIYSGWAANNGTGWGGGLSVADMDADGNPEIAYGRTIFTTAVDAGVLTIARLGEGTASWGRATNQGLSFFVDLDDDPELELIAGDVAYEWDGTAVSVLWDAELPGDGFAAVANFDADAYPEVVVVANSTVHILDGSTGLPEMTAFSDALATGNGGAPTIADFDGDGEPEIGVAFREYYFMVEPNAEGTALVATWNTQNHDISSSVTGSTVFDFEGDGRAEVVYNDECYLWVYDGVDGHIRFATQTTSFTGTEAALVADVDGDGRAELVVMGNDSAKGCDVAPWTSDDPVTGRPAWVGSDGASAPYRGIAAFRDRANGWVGTRTLWNQHAYSVANICGDNGACAPGASYGSVPTVQPRNWEVSFLNNFRQNVQGAGIFNAPDATTTFRIACRPGGGYRLYASVRNLGEALLPEGVRVEFLVVEDDGVTETSLGFGMTVGRLFPGQVEEVEFDSDLDATYGENAFFARVVNEGASATFRECRDGNNESPRVVPACLL